ncbi:hypothetical protein [Xanthocytophaga flava]|uniref:hypothetical protein n=1 Tax=Xanthocytophaga flava TaxID=3048013 RepID=UPI0028D35EC6|nr:hypothetical protein [Xanthocytophaga flavus]MDJ1470325.1 hypothetical protein [Xanthocytophaga flavus]
MNYTIITKTQINYITAFLGCLFLGILSARADSLWIETEAKGKTGKSQLIKVIFGSYNQYRLQKVKGEFEEVKEFTCWVVSPTGKTIPLSFTPSETSYDTYFTPQEKGIYTVLLENKQRKVEDWRKSSTKIGITKQHYYARTSIQVETSSIVTLTIAE